MMSHTQTLEGLASEISQNEHIVLWDLEGCNQNGARGALSEAQFRHELGDIFIVSDADRSFGAWCFSRRPWKEYLRILLEPDYVYYNFFYWAVRRGAATLRIGNKAGRPPQKVVSFLKGYEETEIPENMVHVICDTGIEKKGVVVKVG